MKFSIQSMAIVLFLAVPLATHAKPPSAQPSSALRVTCEGEDVGAEVFINGQFKGECPVDIPVPEGLLKLRAQKKVDALHQPRLFEQEIRMGEGVAKRVEIQLGQAELNAEGKRREQEQLRAEARKREEEQRKLDALFASVMVAIPGQNFEMGKYEVTQAQWQAVMGTNPSHFKGNNLPVEQVNWHDIQEFITKLNQRTGKNYRLPTNEEWEYACFVGDMRISYCGSDYPYAVAWVEEISGNQTHPVGQLQANGYGLHDMVGNVWEWVEDSLYKNADRRTVRGGCAFQPAAEAKAGPGGGSQFSAAYRAAGIGFRLVRTLK